MIPPTFAEIPIYRLLSLFYGIFTRYMRMWAHNVAIHGMK